MTLGQAKLNTPNHCNEFKDENGTPNFGASGEGDWILPLGVGLLVALPPVESVTTKDAERALMVSECLGLAELKGGTTLGFFYRNQTIPFPTWAESIWSCFLWAYLFPRLYDRN